MIDHESIAAVIGRGGHGGSVAIAACKSGSGAVKEIGYSSADRCFFVTVDGRERLRSDVPETAYVFFSATAPE
ncbi:conserved protein of unknown function [Magnetospirillum sp. XM-1]|uniref:hypothetical protein n=1 Tax=Magnetospirillum sp. XM-1 TaxID=1663591 RepID=UPI00073DF30F|nr:hypothetical protein [Magnetospirillum sp. XM-1]CUW38741.1 conserved protein of unknown function [Magnetospirillum sp. XM-1]